MESFVKLYSIESATKAGLALYAAPEGGVRCAAGDGPKCSRVPPHCFHREAVGPRHLHLHHMIVT